MTKTYTYGISGETAYLSGSDETEEYTNKEVTVEVDENDLINALSGFIVTDYFNSNVGEKEHIKAFIADMDLTEHLCEIYDDYLYDYFSDRAGEV